MAKNRFRDTIVVRKGEELQRDRLEKFLRENTDIAVSSPLEIEQFGTGASNLTYLLRIGEWEAVLRRPPLGPVAPKAHDMAREYQILSRLHPVFPLAPKPYVFCDDRSVIGSPFFLMERRRGIVLDTQFPAHHTSAAALCRQISEVMIDRLAELHRVDYKAAGLEQIGYPEGFMRRQVHGWIERYERAKTDQAEGVEQLKKWLTEHLPISPEPTVIHYDYKLNNVMFDSDDLTKMIGIFDWEMTTIGDPLADLACMLCYWIQEDDLQVLAYRRTPPVTVLPGFMTRVQLIERYAKKSGRDVTRIHFYVTFSYFKWAVICQQIYFRWKNGQTKDQRFAQLGDLARSLIRKAWELTLKNAL
ncbi:phosphotransferase family protein [Brevibacillus massiliensis]|uniref:phosphotransferase family protein n=1 Tax=Brevibacillus massiliensis TaxID=1118054 RepID=UPI000309C17D|nr:phosphotransferase family protein [Brevibacillus massiliensis]